MMKIKRICALCTALVLLLSFVSCGSGPDAGEEASPKINYSFSDIYTFPKMTEYGKEPVTWQRKHNILTGEDTPMCPDPLCDHKNPDECLFSLSVSTGMIFWENSLYFVSAGKAYTDERTGIPTEPERIARYNCETGEVKTLCSLLMTKYEGIQGRLVVRDGYVYFTTEVADPDNRSEGYSFEDAKFLFRRVSIEGGPVEDLGIVRPYFIDGVFDGKLYCQDPFKTRGIVMIDMKTQEETVLVRDQEGAVTNMYWMAPDGTVFYMERTETRAAFYSVKDGEAPRVILQCDEFPKIVKVYQNRVYFKYKTDLYVMTEEGTIYNICRLDPEKFDGIGSIDLCGLGVQVWYDKMVEENGRTKQYFFPFDFLLSDIFASPPVTIDGVTAYGLRAGS